MTRPEQLTPTPTGPVPAGPVPSSAAEARQQILLVAGQLAERGLLSASGHGNISCRLPGADEVCYTATSDLRTLTEDRIARLGLDGEVRSGQLTELALGGARMHLAVYAARPAAGSVVHSHAPFATAYAVAGRPIGCWAEPLAIFGMPAGVPVLPYAERGSEQAQRLISQAAQEESVSAVLLGGHGVLAFGATPAAALHVLTLVEEAAQLGIRAAGLGGAQLLPAEARQ
ncbi:class II aldolase/adducin family protein [Jatrophihabitans sp.]|uniref:class II aldolase/adducin family protein n=1 Tax=Jatrophihabitans sp. TaxID=1932789 RepID=UPI002B5E4695|nr:class II aldolase/adducin family protein [Jatrophihabitans sp.]